MKQILEDEIKWLLSQDKNEKVIFCLSCATRFAHSYKFMGILHHIENFEYPLLILEKLWNSIIDNIEYEIEEDLINNLENLVIFDDDMTLLKNMSNVFLFCLINSILYIKNDSGNVSEVSATCRSQIYEYVYMINDPNISGAAGFMSAIIVNQEVEFGKPYLETAPIREKVNDWIVQSPLYKTEILKQIHDVSVLREQGNNRFITIRRYSNEYSVCFLDCGLF